MNQRIFLTKAYGTQEGKKNIKALLDIDLLELRRVPNDVEELLAVPAVVPETRTRRNTGRTNTPVRPTADEIKTQNEEIEKKC